MLKVFSRVCKKGPRLVGRCCLLIIILVALVAIFAPSYTRPPAHYEALRRTSLDSTEPGRANLGSQRIFIAASLYDPQGDLVSGDWGRSVLELISLLGPNNTFLSIYTSDSNPQGSQALSAFEDGLTCPHRLLSHPHVPLENPPIITLPDGELAVKRIEYLAAARNIALEPLNEGPWYDKILFLNDVYFDPIEAAQLLFLTNTQGSQSKFRAACAADFDNPWKFYDTFATRDSEGYSIGVPLFPWFAITGSAQSRSEVWRQADAVHVKSCWGGMIAFNASYFQSSYSLFSSGSKRPVRFRAERELDWDYSECCLIHEDLDVMVGHGPFASETYLNPYVRTAYDATTFRWLWIGRRTEKILGLIHNMINTVFGLPVYNPLRASKDDEPLRRILWVQNSSTEQGSWTSMISHRNPGFFCRVPGSMVRRLKQEGVVTRWEKLEFAADFARCNVTYM